ncbi:MAG: FkbM family methyltransferase, partial [Gammaproteobacteria bacterium]|nr:FkbM family methyltransferase [Gammaproteobacteria bacterium]
LLPITRLQSSVFPGTGPAGTETVRIERLDGILSNDDIESPALLKLDVQGYELEALKGCDRLLSAFNQVYAECSLLELYENQASAHDVIEFLTEHRFRLQGIYNVYAKDGAAVQGDFLFTQSTEPQNRNN